MLQDFLKNLSTPKKIFFSILLLTFAFVVLFVFLASLSAVPKIAPDDIFQDNFREYIFIDSQNKLYPAKSGELDFGASLKKSTDYNNGGEIIVATLKDNLSEIIANAESGQVIELGPGIFNLNLEIGKDIAITGQGEETILQAEDSEKAILKINNSAFTLKNLILRNSRIGVDARDATLLIENVKFVDFSATACYTRDSDLNFIGSHIYDSNSALKLMNSKGQITDSSIKNNKKSGIQLLGSDFLIQHNIILNNGSYGVFLDQNSEADIKNNYIADNDGYNVRIEKSMEIYR